MNTHLHWRFFFALMALGLSLPALASDSPSCRKYFLAISYPRSESGRTTTAGVARDFVLKEMQGKYHKEDVPDEHGRAVTYLRTESERARFRLTIMGGRIYDSEGRLFDTRGWAHPVPVFGLRDGIPVLTGYRLLPGSAIFVMDKNGNLFAGPEIPESSWAIDAKGQVQSIHPDRSFHHSSFLAGTPVAGAGEIEVHNGMLVRINNNSGHYHPGTVHLNQVIEQLRELGVDTSGLIRVDVSGK